MWVLQWPPQNNAFFVIKLGMKSSQYRKIQMSVVDTKLRAITYSAVTKKVTMFDFVQSARCGAGTPAADDRGWGGGVHINGFSVKRRKLEIPMYAFYLILSTKEGLSVFEPAPDAKMGKLTSEE